MRKPSKNHPKITKNTSQNQPRRPPEPSCVPSWRPEAPKIAPGGLRKRKKQLSPRPRGPKDNFRRFLDLSLGGPAGVARPVKAYSGVLGQATRLNDFKHAHHRKRWSADSYRFATPGGHPGIQGSRAFNLYVFHLMAAKRRARRRARRRPRKPNGAVKHEENHAGKNENRRKLLPREAPEDRR